MPLIPEYLNTLITPALTPKLLPLESPKRYAGNPCQKPSPLSYQPQAKAGNTIRHFKLFSPQEVSENSEAFPRSSRGRTSRAKLSGIGQPQTTKSKQPSTTLYNPKQPDTTLNSPKQFWTTLHNPKQPEATLNYSKQPETTLDNRKQP